MKTTQYTSKLSAYSTMAAAFMVTFPDADAQTAYTNLSPDKVLTSTGPLDTLHLDVDGDNVTDFIFNIAFSYSSYASASNYYFIVMNGVGGDRMAFSIQTENIYTFFNAYLTNMSANVLKTFPTGAQINGVNNFINSAAGLWYDCFPGMFSTVPDYCWSVGIPSNTVKNIGFRLKNGPLKYYGWMRVMTTYVAPAFNHPTSITIFDYAINLTSGATVLAGVVPIIIFPDDLGTGWLATTQAKLVWDPVEYVQQYEIQYRQADAGGGAGGAWTTVMVPGAKTNVKLTGLTCNTPYEWQIRSRMIDAGISEFSPIQNFSTLPCRLDEGEYANLPEFNVYTYGEQLFVQSDEILNVPVIMEVFDQLGQKVFSTQYTGEQTSYTLELATGIYVVLLQSENDRQVHQVSVQ